MAKATILVSLALITGACDQREPVISDMELQSYRETQPGLSKKCLEEIKYGGIGAWRYDDPECFEMRPARRWSGVWNAGWEWSAFCPNKVGKCDPSQPGAYWTLFGKNALKSRPEFGLYKIDFVGRRTTVAGGYGHMAGYEHMIVVDKILAMELLEARPIP